MSDNVTDTQQPDAPTSDAPLEDEAVERQDMASEATDAQAEAPAQAPAEADEVVVPEDDRDRTELILAAHAAEAERDDHLDQLRRLQAEFDNFRRRSARESLTQREAGVADVATKLLDVLDDFDMALLSVDKTEDVAALHKGLELVYAKFISTLTGVGLQRIDAEGVVFDPERHDAVQQVTSDEPVAEPIVADVLRAGYTLGGKVLRPAMVKVAQ